MKEQPHVLSARFSHQRYALMPHADHFKLTPAQEQDPRKKKFLLNTVDSCKQNIRALVDFALTNFIEARESTVVVFHAPSDKCSLTADLILGELKLAGIRASKRKPINRLSDNSSGIDSDLIDELCDGSNPLQFTIFVTHMSVIQSFLGTVWEPKNGAIITKDFIIVDGQSQ